EGYDDSLFERVAMLPRHREQAYKLGDFLRRYRPAERPMREISDDLSLAASFVMAVQMAAGVDLFQALERGTFWLVIGSAYLGRGDSGVVSGNLFGSAGRNRFPDLGDSLRRKIGRRLELGRRRDGELRGIWALECGRQSVVEVRDRGGDPVITGVEPDAEILCDPPQFLSVLRKGCHGPGIEMDHFGLLAIDPQAQVERF